jgi:hypothetical protein
MLEKLGFQQVVEETLTVGRKTRAMTIIDSSEPPRETAAVAVDQRRLPTQGGIAVAIGNGVEVSCRWMILSVTAFAGILRWSSAAPAVALGPSGEMRSVWIVPGLRAIRK